MRISDWSSDVCSSDLLSKAQVQLIVGHERRGKRLALASDPRQNSAVAPLLVRKSFPSQEGGCSCAPKSGGWRSEEHTSELQSLMRTSYAVLCLKNKNNSTNKQHEPTTHNKNEVNC